MVHRLLARTNNQSLEQSLGGSMNIGDLVTIRNHPEHLGVITDFCEEEEDCYGWITVLWFSNDDGFNESKIPLSSAKHIEVLQ